MPTPGITKKKGCDNTLFWLSIACAVLAGTTRVLYCWKYPVPARDAFTYKSFMELWNSSGIFPMTDNFPPLSIYLLKIPASLFFYDTIKGGVIVNVILGIAIIILLVNISHKIIPSYSVATAIGCIAATHPSLIHYSCQMLRENSYLFFTSLWILSITDFLKKKKVINIAFAGLFTSAACLCRFEALELFIISCIIIMFWSKTKNSIKLKILGFYVSVFFLSHILIMTFINVPLSYYKQYAAEFNEKS